jgi:hypothetical protein
MRRHPLLRTVALLLLVWVAVDLAAIDTCVHEVDEAGGDPGSAGAFEAPPPPHLPLIPHHHSCVCHGQTVASDAPAALAAPTLVATSVADATAASPRDADSALYHPPQLGP